ncbi:hypothetical protein V2J09_000757 [Rumex salicifolius]
MEVRGSAMEGVDEAQHISSPTLQTLPIARSYQLEALEKAIKQNTIVFLEAGSGKTLIAVMLLRSHSHLLKQSSSYKAVFLVPTVVLVTQQAQVVRNFTDLKVGTYSGEMKINLWDVNTWKEELDKHEVLVMTPQILLNALRHSFISLELIKVLIFDECHNALKDHPYAQIMKEFYHPLSLTSKVPRIFGMTASPVKAKESSEASQYWVKMQQLENLMDSKLYTCEDPSMLDGCISLPEVKYKEYDQNDAPFSMDVKNKLTELVTKVVQENDISRQWKRPGHAWSIHDDAISEANTRAGFLSSKVVSLQKCLLEYREIRDLRCIVFVERVITSIALQLFLNEKLEKECGWKTKYTARPQNHFKSQSRQDQHKVIDEFRAGKVNVIVATSILEEGLDVQSCNLVIRFDPSSNICSFIQSRGRARMKDSDFVLMVKRGDEYALAKAKLLIDSIDTMRTKTLLHSSLPCQPIELNLSDQMSYTVESTGTMTSFESSFPLHNVILVFNTKLDLDLGSTLANIQVNKGCKIDVKMKYLREDSFTKQQLMLCRMFQVVVFRALGGQSFDKLNKAIDEVAMSYDSAHLDYLILPSTCSSDTSPTIDWRCISSVLFHRQDVSKCHENCFFPKETPQIQTKNGLICRCMLKNSLVYTPHNGYVYFIYGFTNHLNINSNMCTDEGEDVITYKDHFKRRHGIDLRFDNEVLHGARPMFRMHNFLLNYGQRKRKASDHTYCELPPELCYVIMSPISATTFYTFSLVSLIIHRIESVLIAANLQRMYADQCTQDVITIPTMKGFIRNRVFDPTHWCAPGDRSIKHWFIEELVASGKRMYKIGTQRLKSKRVADVVEALIGAFLSCGGEMAALSFMNWLGIGVDSSYIPYNNQFQIDHTVHVDVNYLQSLLQYTFRDPSLLVEALTHGSYMISEIPRCYQRLEFLGDAVLDHIITLHLYSENPGLSPGLLTEMRSASVNNDCYAYATIRVQLHKHILHASNDLHKDFEETLRKCKNLLPKSTFGWEFDIHFPKVLGDVIESLAGAIFVDSGYDKDAVFKSLKPLLEPLVTPKTLKIHPMQELQLLCQEYEFVMKKPVVCKKEDGSVSYKIEVEIDGVMYSETRTANDKKLAQKIASKAMLTSLKDLGWNLLGVRFWIMFNKSPSAFKDNAFVVARIHKDSFRQRSDHKLDCTRSKENVCPCCNLQAVSLRRVMVEIHPFNQAILNIAKNTDLFVETREVGI